MTPLPSHLRAMLDASPVRETTVRAAQWPQDVIRLAADQAKAGANLAVVRGVAAWATRDTKSATRAPRDLARWIRANLSYRREATALEYLAGPVTTLRTGAGDCDDLAILWASLALSMGIDAAPAAMRIEGRWCHMVGICARGVFELSDERFYGGPRSSAVVSGRPGLELAWWDGKEFRGLRGV